MIGDLVQQGVTQNDFSVTGAFLAVGTIGVLTVLFSYLPLALPAPAPGARGRAGDRRRARQASIEKNLKRQRHHAGGDRRGGADAADRLLDEVRWAVLETSGQMSFITKSGD